MSPCERAAILGSSFFNLSKYLAPGSWSHSLHSTSSCWCVPSLSLSVLLPTWITYFLFLRKTTHRNITHLVAGEGELPGGEAAVHHGDEEGQCEAEVEEGQVEGVEGAHAGSAIRSVVTGDHHIYH